MAYDLSKLLERLPADPELEEAQARDVNRGNWQRVSDDLYSAFSRKPFQATELPSEAGQIVAKRDAGLKRLTGAAALDDIATKNDPDSVEAKLYRPLVKAQYGKAGIDAPAELDTANAGALAGVSTAVDRYETASKVKGKAAMDVSVAQEWAKQGRALEEQAKVPEDQRTDWDALVAKGADQIKAFVDLRRVQLHEGGVATRAEKAGERTDHKLTQGDERVALAKRGMELKELEAAGKAQGSLATGYQLIDPLKAPDKAVSKDLEDTTATANQVLGTLGELKHLLAKNNGRMLPTDEDYIHYSSLFAAALGKLIKAQGMGNLTVAHQHLSGEFVNDPTKLTSWINNNLPEIQVDDLAREVKSSLEAKATASGYRALRAGEKQAPSAYAPAAGLNTARKNAATPPPGTPDPADIPTPPGKVKVKWPVEGGGFKIKFIPKEKVGEAQLKFGAVLIPERGP